MFICMNLAFFVILLSISIYIYKTEAFEVPTIFHVSTILKKKKLFKTKKKPALSKRKKKTPKNFKPALSKRKKKNTQKFQPLKNKAQSVKRG